MSMTPADSASGAAGVSRPQTLGSELDRMRLAAAERARLNQARQQAEQAAGVGRTPVNPHVADRDADGRQGWVMPDPDKPGACEPDANKTDAMPHGEGDAPEAESPADADETPGTRLDVRG